MTRITRHNKPFKYEYELTPMRRFERWVDSAVSYAILLTTIFALTMVVINLAQHSLQSKYDTHWIIYM